MRSRKMKERGQALILIALAMVGMVAMVGLAVDGSAKFSDQRHAQNAADTAAIAAALAKVNALAAGQSNTPATCPPSSGLPSAVCTALLNAGRTRATSNGYDGNVASNTVSVYSPPINGPYTGDAKYVQVVITSIVNTTFARVIGINQMTNVVEAVALAKEGGPLFDGASFISVNPSPSCSAGTGSGGGSFDVGGSGNIILNGGGIFVNSSASCGYSQTSCNASLTINGGGILSAGSDINLGGCVTGVSTDETKRQYVVPDEIYMPERPAQCLQTPAAPTPLGGNKWRLHPGYYQDFPPTSTIGNNKVISLTSGIYCIDADVFWNGNRFQSFTGTSGVTFFITDGHDFNVNINSPITLNALDDPNSVYDGYLIILEGTPADIESCTINGGSYLQLNGTIFAPYCDITINGDNASASTYNVQVIGWNVKLNGNNTINFTYNPSNNAKNPKKVGLME